MTTRTRQGFVVTGGGQRAADGWGTVPPCVPPSGAPESPDPVDGADSDGRTLLTLGDGTIVESRTGQSAFAEHRYRVVRAGRVLAEFVSLVEVAGFLRRTLPDEVAAVL